jgi:hypothetical protein
VVLKLFASLGLALLGARFVACPELPSNTRQQALLCIDTRAGAG